MVIPLVDGMIVSRRALGKVLKVKISVKISALFFCNVFFYNQKRGRRKNDGIT